MNHTTDELQLYFNRLKPIYRELFGTAHAICGNYDLAEYALDKAILESWTRHERRRRVGFRESLRSAVRHIAAQEALKARDGDAEFTWDALGPDALDGAEEDLPESPEELLLRQEVQAESLEMRRMLMLHYGCGLKPKTIGRLLGVGAGQASGQLERFAARTRRKLPARQRRHFDASMTRLIREELIHTGPNVPDMGTAYRTFEVEASQSRRSPRKYISRGVSAVVFVALAVICALLFWLVAVLMQPPRLEQPETPPAEEFFQEAPADEGNE